MADEHDPTTAPRSEAEPRRRRGRRPRGRGRRGRAGDAAAEETPRAEDRRRGADGRGGAAPPRRSPSAARRGRAEPKRRAPRQADEPPRPSRRERAARGPSSGADRPRPGQVRPHVRRARRGSSATTSAASPSTRRARSSRTRPRAVARDWAKLLESAVANAEHNHELVGDDLRDRRGHGRRGPDPQALPPARHGPRDAHPQAHEPPHDHAHAEGVATSMGQKVHPESHARGLHPRLEVELVQRAALRRLPGRGRRASATTSRQARARRPVRHHDPQGRQRGRGQHPHGASRAS